MYIALIDSPLTHNLNMKMCTALTHCSQIYKSHNKSDYSVKHLNHVSVEVMMDLLVLVFVSKYWLVADGV